MEETGILHNAIDQRQAKFQIGQVVQHRIFDFRGVIFDVDPEFANSLGFPVRALDILLTSLLVVAVMIGLQTVGVVLMAAMVIGPGTAARQWTDRLLTMLVLAGAFGAMAGVTGAVLSVQASRLPTGPMIILALTVIVLFSIFFAPNRGIVPDILRRRQQRARIRQTGEPAGLPEVTP